MALDIPLAIDSTSGRGLTDQICDQLVTMIRHGRLRSGDVLPPSRQLSKQLGVARNTVIAAYATLIEEGYLEALSRAGTRVARQTVGKRTRDLPSRSHRCAPSRPPKVSEAAKRVRLNRPTLFDPTRCRLPLDFRIGLPDNRLFPSEARGRCIRGRLSASGLGFTDYSDPAGVPELRSAIAHLVRLHRGVACTSDQVIITTGVQQGLDLACRLLLDPGDAVVVEDPVYTSALEAMRAHGATITPCPIAADGIDTQALPPDGARFAYVTPSHQFPLGNTMGLATRLALLEWARVTGTYLIEDDYDSDFRYRGSPLSALASLDSDELVIYLGTFSKTLGAGLRMGYMVLPAPLITAARNLKDLTDHGRSWLEQVSLADFINLGHYEHHVRRAKTAYSARCQLLNAGLRAIVPGSEVMGTDGGMHLTWLLPPEMPIAVPLQRRLAQEGVVIYTLREGPSTHLTPSELTDRILLFGYPCLTEDKITVALERVAECIEQICPGRH